MLLSQLRPIWTIIAIGFIVYFLGLYPDFVWDDKPQITDNPLLGDISNLPRIAFSSVRDITSNNFLTGSSYKPVMTTTFGIFYIFFGKISIFYHLFQIALHILNSILVFYLFKDFFKKGIALFLSLVFLIHPINTETVVYISALQDIYFLFFGLLSLHVLRKNYLPGKTLIIISILLLLSILSKETGVLFFAILPLYSLLFKINNWKKVAFVCLGTFVIFLSIKFAVFENYYQYREKIPINQVNIIERSVYVPVILSYYFKTFFFPKDLAIDQQWAGKDINQYQYILDVVLIGFLTMIVFITAKFFKSNNLQFKSLGFFLSILVSSLALHSQILTLDLTVSERWFYLPEIGLLGIIGLIMSNWKINMNLKIINYVLITILVVLSIRTIVRTLDWVEPLTLYSRDIKISKHSASLYNNLAMELTRINNFDEAEKAVNESIKINPHWWSSWTTLGNIYVYRKEYSTSEQYYKKAIENKPNFYLAHTNLVNAWYQQHKLAEAEEHIKQNLDKFPYGYELWGMLIIIQNELGKKEEAIENAKLYYQKSQSLTAQTLLNSLQTQQN